MRSAILFAITVLETSGIYCATAPTTTTEEIDLSFFDEDVDIETLKPSERSPAVASTSWEPKPHSSDVLPPGILQNLSNFDEDAATQRLAPPDGTAAAAPPSSRGQKPHSHSTPPPHTRQSITPDPFLKMFQSLGMSHPSMYPSTELLNQASPRFDPTNEERPYRHGYTSTDTSQYGPQHLGSYHRSWTLSSPQQPTPESHPAASSGLFQSSDFFVPALPDNDFPPSSLGPTNEHIPVDIRQPPVLLSQPIIYHKYYPYYVDPPVVFQPVFPNFPYGFNAYNYYPIPISHTEKQDPYLDFFYPSLGRSYSSMYSE